MQARVGRIQLGCVEVDDEVEDLRVDDEGVEKYEGVDEEVTSFVSCVPAMPPKKTRTVREPFGIYCLFRVVAGQT